MRGLTLELYLQERFPEPDIAGGGPALVEHFCETFGVRVRQENNLFQFKYEIGAKFSLPLTHQCRGSILRWKGGLWAWCARPFDKFFNRHEGYCGLRDDADLERALPSLVLSEKVDGTCVLAWYDEDQARWRLSTMGAITPEGVRGYPGLTFEDLFWRTMQERHAPPLRFFWEDLDRIGRGWTTIMELASLENRILTRYERACVYFLSRRSLSGVYDSIPSRDLTIPRTCFAVDLGLRTSEDLGRWLVEQSRRTDLYGEHPEGFVGYLGGKPVVKLKHESYLTLLAATKAGGSDQETARAAARSVLNGSVDDLYQHFPPLAQRVADLCKERLAADAVLVEAAARTMRERGYPTRKDFALDVQALVPREYQPLFYTLGEKKARTAGERLADYLRGQSEKRAGDWAQEALGKAMAGGSRYA